MILTLMISAEVWDLNRFNTRGYGPGRLIPGLAPPGQILLRSLYQCKDGYVVAYFYGGASSEALVAWANEDGYMLELKDFDWSFRDQQPVTQEELEDSDYMDHLLQEGRKERDDIERLLQEFLMTKTKAECLQRAVEHAILLIPVNDVKDVQESSQMKYREFFNQVEHPELGESIAYPGFPILMNGVRPGVQRRAPLIGEHNQEVYEKELGISGERLVLLKNRGVI